MAELVLMRGIETMLGIDFAEIGMLPVVSESKRGQFVAMP